MKSFDELNKEFLHSCKHARRLDPKTLRAYRTDLLQFQSWLLDNGLPFADKNSIGSYMEALHQKYSPASVRRKIATLKAFYHYAEKKDYAANPFHKLDTSFREPRRLPRYVPLHAIQELADAIYQAYLDAQSSFKKKHALRDLAVIGLLFSTGIRISELCCLPAAAIDLKAREMKIFGKGAKERLLQLEPGITEMLTRYQDTFQKQISREGYFFASEKAGHISDQSVRYMINKYTLRTDGKLHITPHMLRHTFAKSLLDQGVDIRIIQPILGHSSIKTTERYTHVSSSKQKEVLQNKNPLSLISVRMPK